MEKILTVRQKKFADGFLAGLSKTDSLKQAGYAVRKKEGITQAADLMRNPAVQKYISESRQKMETELNWTRLDFLKELQTLGTRDCDRPRDRTCAMDLAAKILGYFSPKKIEIEQKNSIELDLKKLSIVEIEILEKIFLEKKKPEEIEIFADAKLIESSEPKKE